jgi:hypothetical protein
MIKSRISAGEHHVTSQARKGPLELVCAPWLTGRIGKGLARVDPERSAKCEATLVP